MPALLSLNWQRKPDAQGHPLSTGWGGCILLAWLLAGIPGHVVASVGAFTIETSTPIAILILVALFVVTIHFDAYPACGPGNPPIHRGLAPPPSPYSWRKNRYARVSRLGSW